jgi:hypothetical protein
MIKVEYIDHGTWQEVIGTVDKREIICMNNNIEGKWGVSTSAILPWSLARSEEVLECYNLVFERVREVE